MIVLDVLSRLSSRLCVAAFASFIVFLIGVRVLSAVDWLWFLPDDLGPTTAAPTAPAPAPQPPRGCITMPDGTLVCDEPVPATSARRMTP